jgi:anti-sigma regulatory factor (Ser/Thr protein kinase)
VTGEVPLEEPAIPSNGAEAAAMLDQEFSVETLHVLREAVLAHASAAGMPDRRATDVMLVVHELAANAVLHGGGTGRLRMHIAAGRLYCQVTDQGTARSNGRPLADAAGQSTPSPAPEPEPWPCQPGHGLWLIRQAADQFTVSTGPRGSQVIVSFALPAHPESPLVS